MKTQKTISLDVEVAKRLDEEDNQSKKIQELLKDEYGMD